MSTSCKSSAPLALRNEMAAACALALSTGAADTKVPTVRTAATNNSDNAFFMMIAI